MPVITEANKVALREWWSEVKMVMSDPLLYVMAAIVAFLFCIPWLCDNIEVAIFGGK